MERTFSRRSCEGRSASEVEVGSQVRKPSPLSSVVGKRIARILKGRWEPARGVDMPGLAWPVWHYCDLFVVFEESSVLRVTPEGNAGMQVKGNEKANALLTREYRAPFVVPKLT